MSTPPNELFWEQAHLDGSDEHPLARELADRVDALHRYRRQLADAEAGGHDERAEVLAARVAIEEEACRRLLGAVERLRGGE